MPNLPNQVIYKRLLTCAVSQSPHGKFGDYAAALSAAGVENERIATTFAEFLDFFMHECSPFRSGRSYENICRELSSIIDRTKLQSPPGPLKPENRARVPSTVDEWDALSDEQKTLLSSQWDVYQREGLGFVMLAAARLVLSSPIPIIEAHPGIFHGGQWVINASVHERDIDDCPQDFSAKSDGFDVYWFAYPPDRSAIPAQPEGIERLSDLLDNNSHFTSD